MKTTTLLLVLAVAGACSKDKPAAAKTTPDVAARPEPKPDAPAPSVDTDTQVSPGIALAGDLASQCNIKAAKANPTTPNFDYDKDELTTDDRAALDQLASCLTTGPLKGKAVSLIGRADPRGTEEYNLGLGSRRAATVGKYLARLGVTEPQLAVTTRGALEATGTDEASWRQDRRVDIQLRVN